MARRENDAYFTPDALAVACVATIPRDLDPEIVVEPSVGGGAFARAVRARWPATYLVGVDVDSDAPGFAEVDVRSVGDWLARASAFRGEGVDLAVGNPPYCEAEAHVRAALEAVPRVAFLLRLGFLAGKDRGRGFWREHPPSVVHVVSRRPSFTGNGRSDGTEYAFFVWDRRPDPRGERTGMPRVAWLEWTPARGGGAP